MPRALEVSSARSKCETERLLSGTAFATIPSSKLLRSNRGGLFRRAEITAEYAGGPPQPLDIVLCFYKSLRKPRSWSPGRYRLNLPFSGFVLLSAFSFMARVASR
jgi:hypothetical protein